MDHQSMFAIVLILGFFGCTDSVQDSARPGSNLGEDGVIVPDTERRPQRVGPVSFVPPLDWETRPATQTPGLVMFAPERPEWSKIGFRANLAVRRRPHPGVSLDRFRESLDQMLARSVEHVNETLAQYVKKVSKDGPVKIPLRQKGDYTITIETKDGVPVLMSTFSGVFELEKELIATKTYGMQFLDSDALFSISLTFPRKFESEMEAVWRSFQENVRITK